MNDVYSRIKIIQGSKLYHFDHIKEFQAGLKLYFFSVCLSSVERRRPNPNQRLLSRPDMQGEAEKRYTTPLVELLKELKQPGLINTAQ